MADETLLYTASFDPTGILQGEAVAAKAFTDLDKKAAQAFSGVDRRAAQARTSLMQVGTVGKGTGMAVQQAGFQVGDFFVQLASGQGVIRPLIQQSTQLLQVFGMWGSVIGAGVAVLGSLYVALKGAKNEAKEFSATEAPEWITDRSMLIAVRYDLEALEAAQTGLSEQIKVANGAMSAASVYLIAYGKNADAAAEAAFRFKKLVGMSPEEFKQQVSRFATFNEYVTDAQNRVNAHLIDLQADLQQEQAKAKQNELDKLLSMEKVAYQKSIQAERARYSAIRDDVKKSDAERVKAANDLTKALELVDQTHAQKVVNITAQYNDKVSEKDAAEGKRRAAEAKRERERQEREAEAMFKAMATAREKELQELRNYQATKADIAADLGIREIEANGSDDVAKLEARQARETQALQKRLDDQAKNLDLSIQEHEEYYAALDRLAEIHAVERGKVVTEQTEKEKKVMKDAARDMAQAWVSLGGVIADTFDIKPLQSFLKWLQAITTAAEALATIKRTSSILGLFSAGAGVGASSLLGGAPSVLPFLGLAKNQTVPDTDYTPPGSLARASASQERGMNAGASYSFGDINVHVPPGTPTQAIPALLKSAVVEAAEQIEKNRNQRHYTNGTFQF